MRRRRPAAERAVILIDPRGNSFQHANADRCGAAAVQSFRRASAKARHGGEPCLDSISRPSASNTASRCRCRFSRTTRLSPTSRWGASPKCAKSPRRSAAASPLECGRDRPPGAHRGARSAAGVRRPTGDRRSSGPLTRDARSGFRDGSTGRRQDVHCLHAISDTGWSFAVSMPSPISTRRSSLPSTYGAHHGHPARPVHLSPPLIRHDDLRPIRHLVSCRCRRARRADPRASRRPHRNPPGGDRAATGERAHQARTSSWSSVSRRRLAKANAHTRRSCRTRSSKRSAS